MVKAFAAYLTLAATVVALLLMNSRRPVAAHESLLMPQPLASPAPAGSAQPQMTVSDRGVLLSWVERSGTHAALKFAERTAAGWTEPEQVAAGSDWFVNWADVPSVIRLADGTIFGHWLQKSGPSTYAYDVRLARSGDDGKTFSAPLSPHDDGTQTEHGFASLFQMPGAGLGLVWLDGRAMKSGAGHGSHAGGGEMSLRGAIYDRAGKQISEGPLDLRVCECCPTAVAVTAEGPIAAYRDRSPDEVRDIYVSRFIAGKWTTPVAVHSDNWQIAACPVNGPALSADANHVAIAWFTAKNNEPHAYAAFSSDSGASFGAPIRLDDVGSLGRVDVQLVGDGSVLATWIEFAESKAQFKARRIEPGGERSAAFTVAGLAASRASGIPRMARFGNEVIFAWTETGDAPGVRTASLRVPVDSSAPSERIR